MFKKLMTYTSLGLLLLQVSCGDKKDEEVNIKNLAFVNQKAVLIPTRSLAVKGDLDGNKPFEISFALYDSKQQLVVQKQDELYVKFDNPASDKKSLSLATDMKTHIYAGQNACNGTYTLQITAKLGQSKATKPLQFRVEQGRDPSFCANKGKNSLHGSSFIGNTHGKDRSGFDLETGEHVKKKETDRRDLSDLTILGKQFSQRFGSTTGTEFVQYSGLNFETVNFSTAMTYFNAGVKKPETDVLHSGDILLAQIKRGERRMLYIVKITFVDAKASVEPTSKNKGLVRFNFRRLGAENNS